MIIVTSEVEDTEEFFSPTPTEFVEIEESSFFSLEPSFLDTFTDISSQVDIIVTSDLVFTEEIEMTEVIESTEEILVTDIELSTAFDFIESPSPSEFFQLLSSQSETFIVQSTVAVSSVIEELSPTMLASSSLLVTTAEVLPSPTPTPIICNEPNTIQPLIPLDIEVLGYGFKDITEDAPESDEADYVTTISPIPRPGLASSRSSDVQISLEGVFLGSAVLAHPSGSNPVDIRGALSGNDIYIDRQTVTAIVQARNQDFNTNFTVEITRATDNTRSYNCLTTQPYGYCIIALTNLPIDWFPMDSDISVPVRAKVTGQQEYLELGNVTLVSSFVEHMPGSLYTVGPNYPVKPGEEISIQVYAAYDTFLYVYSIDCKANGSRIIDAKALFEWSLLTDRFDANQVSATGFRNYNQFNTSSTGMIPDSLFNLTIQVDDTVSGNIQIQCTPIKLAFTNGSEIQGSTDIQLVNLEVDGIVELFAHASQTELLNIPLATMNNTIVPLTIMSFNRQGELSQVSASCSSSDVNILQVMDNCSGVFFSGKETSGSQEVEIRVSAENLATSVYFKVLYVYNVSLELEDEDLNSVLTSCTDMLYQRSPVSIIGLANTKPNSTPLTVRLNEYLNAYLMSSDTEVANVSNGEVIGVNEGTADIYLSNMVNVNVQVTVNNTPVCVYSLDIIRFSDVSVEVRSVQQPPQVAVSLLQQYQYIPSNLTLIGVATFSDGYRMRIGEADGITFEIDSDDVNQTSFNQYRLIRPGPTINVTALWMFAECEIIKNEVSVVTLVDGLPTLNVTASSTVLAYENDLAAYFDASTNIELVVSLVYPDHYSVRISSDDPALLIDCPNNLICSQTSVRATGNCEQPLTVAVYYNIGTISLSIQIEIELEYVTSLMLAAWVSEISNVTVLKRVGNSDRYQPAYVQAMLHFNTGRAENVTSNITLEYLSSSPDVLLDSEQLLYNSIAASSNSSLSINVTLQGTLRLGSSSVTGNLTILLSEERVQVRSIDDIILKESLNATNEVYIDCLVTLQDGTKLDQTFQNGIPLYRNLINFTTNDSDFARVKDGGILALLNNSLNLITLTASSSNTQRMKMFYSNLKPMISEADLGENSIETIPLSNVQQGESFTVPVILNSGTNSVGVYKLNIRFDPKGALEVDQVEQGENWLNGSLVYYNSENLVTISGVLNTGARGSLIRLANITFTACSSCCDKVTFSIDVMQLFEATSDLNSVLVENMSTSSVELQITSGHTRRKRSAELAHHVIQRRQTSSTSSGSVVGDFNNDNMVDLRDVYVLQEYISAAVYNTSFRNLNVSQIGLIEQSSLNLDFTADVSYMFYLDSSSECMLQINGTVKNADANSSFTINTESVHVLLAFISDDSMLLNNFNSHNSITDSERGILEPELSGTGEFLVSGNVSSTIMFELNVFIVVETGEPSGDSLGLVDSSFSRHVISLPIADAKNDCVLLPSSSVLPSLPSSSDEISITIETVATTTVISSSSSNDITVTSTPELSSSTIQSPEPTSTTTIQPTETTSSTTTIQPTSSTTTVQPSEPTSATTTIQPSEPTSSTTTIQPTSSTTTIQPSEPTSSTTTIQPSEPTSSTTTIQPSEPTSSTTTIQPFEPTSSTTTIQPSPTSSTTTIQPSLTSSTTTIQPSPTSSTTTIQPSPTSSTTAIQPTSSTTTIQPSEPTSSTTTSQPTSSTTTIQPSEPTSSTTIIQPSEPTSSTTTIQPSEPTAIQPSSTTMVNQSPQEPTESTPNVEETVPPGTSSPIGYIFGSMAAIVAILATLIVIAACVVKRQRKSAKGLYSPAAEGGHRLSSNRLSGNFFYNAEEGIVS